MDDNRAEAWEFLLQCKGDPAWMPLTGDRLALVEGKYRIALHKPDTVGAEVDVRVTFVDLDTSPPKCRNEQRHCRTDIHGMALVMPPTHFKPGRWDIRCYGDLLEELSGSAWRKQICLEVTPSFHLANDEAEAIVESVLAELVEFEEEVEDEIDLLPLAFPDLDLAAEVELAREPAMVSDLVANGTALMSEPAIAESAGQLQPPPDATAPAEAAPRTETTPTPAPQVIERADLPGLDIDPNRGPDPDPVVESVISPGMSNDVAEASALPSPADALLPPSQEEPKRSTEATHVMDMRVNSSALRSQLLANFDSYLTGVLETLEAVTDRVEPRDSSPSLPGVTSDNLADRDRDWQRRLNPLPERLAPAPVPPPGAKQARRTSPQLPPLPGPHTQLRAQVTRLLSEQLPIDAESKDVGPEEFPTDALDSISETEVLPVSNLATNLAPLASPHLEIPADPIAGQTARVRVRLPADSEANIVKLWLLDGNSGLLLDGPQRISRFTLNRLGDREAVTRFKMPFGCLVARLEAIALQDSSDRSSSKVAIERCVSLPNIRRPRAVTPVPHFPKTSS